MKQGKVWGTTQPIYQDDHFEVNRIFAKDGGYCSLHKHECKANMFYVESGKLEIEVHKKDYALIDKTVIGPGESTVVLPGEAHRFRALENTVAFEIYYVKLLPNDIQREDHGGDVSDIPEEDAIPSERCNEFSPNRDVCTRKVGHDGDHVAKSGGRVIAKWSKK